MQIRLPLKTTNPLNGSHRHWIVKSKERKHQRTTTAETLRKALPLPLSLPLVVTLTRVAPSNGLDDDSLPASMKAVRDGIADWLGLKNDRVDGLDWRYAQRRGAKGEYAVEAVFSRPA